MTAMSKGKVLIIDDDSDVRDVTAVTLEVHGFEVHTMRDGIDAVDLTEHFDAILLDVQMPVFDGERLVDYWLLTNPGLLQRVVIITGYSRRRWQEAAQKAFAIVHKPFHYEEILRVVNECVTRARSSTPLERPCQSNL